MFAPPIELVMIDGGNGDDYDELNFVAAYESRAVCVCDVESEHPSNSERRKHPERSTLASEIPRYLKRFDPRLLDAILMRRAAPNTLTV